MVSPCLHAPMMKPWRKFLIIIGLEMFANRLYFMILSIAVSRRSPISKSSKQKQYIKTLHTRNIFIVTMRNEIWEFSIKSRFREYQKTSWDQIFLTRYSDIFLDEGKGRYYIQNDKFLPSLNGSSLSRKTFSL